MYLAAQVIEFFLLMFTGKVGELTMELSDLVWGDMVAGPESHRTLVPYRKKN